MGTDFPQKSLSKSSNVELKWNKLTAFNLETSGDQVSVICDNHNIKAAVHFYMIYVWATVQYSIQRQERW